MATPGNNIDGPILIHHINPLTEEDFYNWDEDKLFNPENLVSVSYNTHNKIHYRKYQEQLHIERKPGDTQLW